MPSFAVDVVQNLAANHVPTDEKERKQLYDAAVTLMHKVESAQDTAQRLYHGHLPLATAQTGMDLNLWRFLAENSNTSFSTQELANITACEPALLVRLLRFYAAHGMVRQVGTDTFSASNITHNLALPGTAAGIKHYSLTMTRAYNSIPQYLAQEKYKNPTTSAPFNLAYQTDLSVFKWRESNPENAKVGQAFMAAQRIGQRSVWDGLVPLHDFRLSQHDLEQDRVLVCDVGGGSGHVQLEFRSHTPDVKGRIITQDLGVMQEISPLRDELAKNNVTMMSHNFMEEQPVKGAKVYYLRNVIHNWGDEPSKVILSQIAKAMAPDSVVIVDDVVLPQTGASWKQSSMDIAMMTMLAAMERTKEHFVQLLKESGLQLRDVWTYDSDYGDSFIVAVPLAQQATSTNGTPSVVDAATTNGVATNGTTIDSTSTNSAMTNGTVTDSTSTNGAMTNGTATDAAPINGTAKIEAITNEITADGEAADGNVAPEIMTNGTTSNGVH